MADVAREHSFLDLQLSTSSTEDADGFNKLCKMAYSCPGWGQTVLTAKPFLPCFVYLYPTAVLSTFFKYKEKELMIAQSLPL